MRTDPEERCRRLAAEERANVARETIDRRTGSNPLPQEAGRTVTNTTKAKILSHAQEQKSRELAESQERQRILRAIECAKQDRKAKADVRKVRTTSDNTDSNAPLT